MSGEKKLPYPKSVFFIVGNEFCERFSYYGMKAVLTLFLKNVLGRDEDEATEIYHAFGMLCYFTPVFGAMIADSFLGKFKTIFYLSIVYAVGNIVLSLAATPPLNIPALEFSMIGLLLIAIGTGGIKPCVSAFGGDQFVLPQQATQLASFFSVFYFAINAGSLLSTFITPVFRKHQCFGNDCYTLAFSIPAALMITSLVIFVCGKAYYRMKPPEGNVVAQVVKCIFHALSKKSSGSEKKEHWLDYADDKFDKGLIQDIKILLRIFVLYLPLPVFWALFDQQGSRWTFQATRMNGEMMGGWSILPDQMQIANPLLILILIPVFDQILYPFLGRLGILKKPLQRLTVGGLLAGAAFVISGFLELHLQTTYPMVLTQNQSSLHFVNQIPCALRVDLLHNSNGTSVVNQKQALPGEAVMFQHIESMEYEVRLKTIAVQGNIDDSFPCSSVPEVANYKIRTESTKGYTVLLSLNAANQIQLGKPSTPDVIAKSEDGLAFVRFVLPRDVKAEMIMLEGRTNSYLFDMKGNDTEGDGTVTIEVEPQMYTIILQTGNKNSTAGTVEVGLGGSYVISLVRNWSSNSTAELAYKVNAYPVVQPNSVHMLWLLPQFFVMTVAEVMFSVTGLEFSYSQAPESMKSVIQAAWLLTVAFGNLIVLIIAGAKLFQEQWKEFFLFAGLMFVDMLIFMVLAYFYNSEKPNANAQVEHEMKPSENGRDNKAMEPSSP